MDTPSACAPLDYPDAQAKGVGPGSCLPSKASLKESALYFFGLLPPEKVSERFLAQRGDAHALARATLPAVILRWWLRVVDPGELGVDSAGRDLYMQTFCLQLLALLCILFGYTTMVQFEGDTLASQLQNNQFSGSMLLAALAQTVLIVMDRFAYLYRSIGLKALLHFVSAIFIHVAVFFVLPLQLDSPLRTNPVGIIFYLVFAAYFLVGTLQLFYGFPRSPPENSLMSKGYDPPIPLLYRIYLAIPLLLEMRSLLDWVSTRTSLDLFMFLRLKTIHTEAFLNKCEMRYRERDRDVLEGKAPQAPIWKLLFGVLLLVLLVLVILFPAFLFSTLNPTLANNFVTGANIDVSILTPSGSHEIFATSRTRLLQRVSGEYWQYLQKQKYNSDDGNSLGTSLQNGAQVVQMVAFPASPWLPSPPELQDLNQSLALGAAGAAAVTMVLTVHFIRPGPPGLSDISASYSVPVSPVQCVTLLTALNVTQRGASPASAPVLFDAVYPSILRLPGSSVIDSLVTNQTALYYDVGLQLNSHAASDGGNPDVWWTVQFGGALPPLLHQNGTGGLLFNTVSDRIAPTFITSSFASYGVVAIYVTVVVTIARLVRSLLETPTHRIIFEELADADVVMELCEGISLAQARQEEGHLLDEMYLYEVLVKLYRMPDVLARVTTPGRRAHAHLPLLKAS